MGFFQSIKGMIRVELTSADLPVALARIGDEGIALYDVTPVDGLTLRVRIARRDYIKLKGLSDRMGDGLKITGRYGLYWTGIRLSRRPILLSGFLLLLILTAFLPTRILFVEVEGNKEVPADLILERADACGIRFGASRRHVRSEKMKNALVAAIPELQWAGINTRGCVAVISVQEKTDTKLKEEEPAVSRIVANRDAVIVSCTVERGNGICQVGQAVKAGELLVSGYEDCGISIRATRSIAEIYGQTSRELTVISPVEYRLRRGELDQFHRYGLIIGKKRINFYKDSGILGTTCGKMSTVNYLTLPGGFVLPVALVTERWIRYNTEACAQSEGDVRQILCDFSENYLDQQMLAGRILKRSQEFVQADDGYCLHGRYSCIEMIGREQSEETLVNYGKAD